MALEVQVLLANNLKRARARLRMSQMALAQRSGLSSSFVGEIETCKKFPSADALQRLADALAVHPAVLFAPEPHEANEQPVVRSEVRSSVLELQKNIQAEIEHTIQSLDRMGLL